MFIAFVTHVLIHSFLIYWTIEDVANFRTLAVITRHGLVRRSQVGKRVP